MKWLILIQSIYVLMMPILFFPVLSVLSLIFDWVIGDIGSALQILHGSKRQFLNEYLADWKNSMPFSAIFIWFIYMPIYYFIKNKVTTRKIPLFISATFIWVAIGVYLYQFNPIGILLTSLSGAVIQSIFFILNNRPAST